MEESTDIIYNSVEEITDDMLDCKQRLQNIFGDFNNEVKSATNESVFVGNARNTYLDNFNSLSTTFQNYCDLVQEFVDKVKGSSDAEKATDSKIAQKASTLSSDGRPTTSI